MNYTDSDIQAIADTQVELKTKELQERIDKAIEYIEGKTMKIEPGMYVRTCYGIGKVEKINIHDGYEHSVLFKDGSFLIKDDDIVVKPSCNPIDLIEVGDYVNGCKVINPCASFPTNTLNIGIWDYKDTFTPLCGLKIKSIVTKEQFEKENYVIGDD